MMRIAKLYFLTLFLFSPFILTETNAQIEVLDLLKTKSKSTSVVNQKSENLAEAIKSPNPTDPDDLIHFGDLISVDVVGSVEYDWRGNLTPEGVLSGFSFTEEQIYASCESVESVAKRIATEYGKFLNNPKIEVMILDRSNRSISRLFGAIKQPQRFRLRRKVRLNELIILAGGITEKASGEIQILRSFDVSCAAKLDTHTSSSDKIAEDSDAVDGRFLNVRDSTIPNILKIKIEDLLKGKPEANPMIYYGDLITVREAESIYVIGAVENPSKIALRSELTVSRAISSSGGLTKGADSSDIIVFRREAGGTDVINVNLSEIESGAAEDLILKAFDVIEVKGRGRSRSKYPPVIQSFNRKGDLRELPLRIID